jgi:hypothetical protein
VEILWKIQANISELQELNCARVSILMSEILRHRPEIYFNMEHHNLLSIPTKTRSHIVKSTLANYN